MLAEAADTAEIGAGKRRNPATTRDGRPRLPKLEDLDGRTVAARRFRELVGAYASDLGGDLTTAQSAIVQRAASIQLWCECIEATYAATGELDIAAYTTATNALRRLLSDIGLERRSRDVTPTLADYVRDAR